MTLLRTALLIGALAFVSACGSAKKKEEAPAQPAATPAAAAQPAAAPVEAKTEKTKGDKKMTRPAKAAVTADANAKEVKCTSGSDERLLTINPKDGGCELQYTKAGEMKVIATQISGDTRCVEVMAKVRQNLEAAKFTCQ